MKERKLIVSKLVGSVKLPKEFDYKKILEEEISVKYYSVKSHKSFIRKN